jgi:hypothetical protein
MRFPSFTVRREVSPKGSEELLSEKPRFIHPHELQTGAAITMPASSTLGELFSSRPNLQSKLETRGMGFHGNNPNQTFKAKWMATAKPIAVKKSIKQGSFRIS